MWEHKKNLGPQEISKHKITKLVYFEEFDNIKKAQTKLDYLKLMSQEKKVEVLMQKNPEFEEIKI